MRLIATIAIATKTPAMMGKNEYIENCGLSMPANIQEPIMARIKLGINNQESFSFNQIAAKIGTNKGVNDRNTEEK